MNKSDNYKRILEDIKAMREERVMHLESIMEEPPAPFVNFFEFPPDTDNGITSAFEYAWRSKYGGLSSKLPPRIHYPERYAFTVPIHTLAHNRSYWLLRAMANG